MKQIAVILLLTFTICLSGINGQGVKSDAPRRLENLFGRLLKTSDDSVRISISDSVNLMVDSYVRSDSIFTHTFTNLKYLGQITSPDKQLKIVTWNLLLSTSSSRYFCYFVVRSGKENKVYKLTADYSEGPIRTDDFYSDKNWYGALYYEVSPLKKENKGSWMLLGIDYGNPSITRKVIDVITFSPGGEVIFGKKWFDAGEEARFRVVLEYSATAVVSMRFLSDKSIVFDHLVPINPGMKGNREFYAPDFSYDGYEFEKGVWKFQSDVEVRNTKKKQPATRNPQPSKPFTP
jgi:hypothetical protein